MTPPTVSLCVISRKEDQDSLKEAIASCIAYVDEVLVADTSTEGKISLPFVKARILPYGWSGDFAAARNFIFDQANSDVLFWIDSDDIVDNPEAIPVLARAIRQEKADWVYSEYVYQRNETGDVTAKHWKPRLMRKGTGHWLGNVHEDFMATVAVNQVRDEDLGATLQIEHNATEEELKEHSQRNLDIQLAEIERDGDATDPRTIQYTAMSYMGLGNYKEAIPYFLRHMRETGSQEDKFWSTYRTSLCFLFEGDTNRALNFALESMKLFPQWKSSYFLLAAIYWEQEDWAKVIEWTLVGLEKKDPDTLQVVSELDYGILPLARLAEAYLHTGNYDLASETAAQVYRMNRQFPGTVDLVRMCKEAEELEGFVTSFIQVVSQVRSYDRTKAAKLFDLVPGALDDDIRIQRARGLTVPPKVWPEDSIQIYCDRSVEPWAYPSKFSGIGGSEEAVINMAEKLSELGFQVTVFNRCGDMKGTYGGVEYVPYYFFSPNDTYGTLIAWRSPQVFMRDIKAKRKYLWLHDQAFPERFSKKVFDTVDKVLFLSQWHRKNLPECPDDKAFITNNGIDPRDFKDLPEKRPNSLVWTSSYDRGLLPFLKNIWPLIRKEVPDVTLDVAYGWQNIEKEMDQIPSLKELYQELSPLLENTEGVTHHGRIPHLQVAKLLGSSIVYPYASEFGETNNITSQKAQAAGCYVVTTSGAGGTSERVRYGLYVKCANIYSNSDMQGVFARLVINYLKSPVVMPEKELLDIRDSFSWTATAMQWISDLL